MSARREHAEVTHMVGKPITVKDAEAMLLSTSPSKNWYRNSDEEGDYKSALR